MYENIITTISDVLKSKDDQTTKLLKIETLISFASKFSPKTTKPTTKPQPQPKPVQPTSMSGKITAPSSSGRITAPGPIVSL